MKINIWNKNWVVAITTTVKLKIKRECLNEFVALWCRDDKNDKEKLTLSITYNYATVI